MNIKSPLYVALFLSALLFSAKTAAGDMLPELEELRQQLEETRGLYNEKIEALEAQISELENRVSMSESAPLVPLTNGPAAAPPRSSLASMPDISLIGNIVGYFGSDQDNRVYMDEVELALGGYIYPDARADVVIALDRHDDHYDVELEEAYISFFNLPGGFGLQAGRKLIDFGKINPVHGHHYPFVDEPLVSEAYLGDHGFAGNGVSINYLFPLPFFLQGSAGYWHVGGHDCDGHHDGLEFSNDAFNARLWSSFPVADSGELEIGTSYLRAKGGHHYETSSEDIDKINLYGLDLTYRHTWTGLQMLTFRNELYYFHRERFRPEYLPDITGRDLKYDRKGLYSLLHYRLNQYWDGGVRYDWLENFRGSSDDVEQAFSAFLTRSLTESTKIRGQASYHTEDDDWRFYLQAIFGIGPHSHPLE